MRDTDKLLMRLKAQAAAEGVPLSEDIIELLRVVLDLEDKAYAAGYERGHDDGYCLGFDSGYDAGRTARV